MRISNWSSDVCSSDLDGEWNAASGLGVECEAVVERGDGHGEPGFLVIPAQAGVHGRCLCTVVGIQSHWIPAFAGMTVLKECLEIRQHQRQQIRGDRKSTRLNSRH